MNWSHFLIIVRWQNVFIIWLMQSVLYFRYVLPYCGKENYSFISFILFIVATGATLSAGNIYNDIQDVHTDALHDSKPKLIGHEISIPMARKWIIFLIALVTICISGGWAFYNWSILMPLLIFVGIALLYLYSAFLKGTILTGNLIIAILCALSVWMTTLLAPSCELFHTLSPDGRISLIVYGYIINAFIITLLREIVKDKEDAQPDKLAGIYTIGSIADSTFRSIFNVILLLIALINGIWFYLLHPLLIRPDWNLGIFMIFIPLLMILLIFNLPHRSKVYSFLSKLIKIYILFAILLLILWQRG